MDNIAVINSVGCKPVTTSVYDMGDRRTEVISEMKLMVNY